MKAKVAERGQVTIPQALRERLGIVAGTVLDVIEEQGRLIAKKTEAMDAVDLVYGVSLRGGAILAYLPTGRRGTRSHRCGFSDRRTCSGAGRAAVDARPWLL
jgi:AbrB family looped-hinge helix DNA binding protein